MEQSQMHEENMLRIELTNNGLLSYLENNYARYSEIELLRGINGPF